MGLSLIKRLSSGVAPYLYLAVLLVVLAYFLSVTTQDSSRLNDLFLVIFGLAIVITVLLLALLGRSIYKLYRDYKNQVEGSRLTVRLVSLFALLIIVSTTIVYSFSIHFLHRGINSWFDVEIEQALDDALELSRSSLGIRMRTMLRQTRMMSGVLSELPEKDLHHNVRELTKLSGAMEVSIWSLDGQLVISSTENDSIVLPQRPSETIFNQLQQKEDYISLDPSDNDGFLLRAAVLLPKKRPAQQDRFLQVIFPVNKRLSALGKTVHDAYADYKEISYLRKPLITIFTLTLSLIVLLTTLASIWFAIWISRRIVEPLQALSAGTQAVAAGNYNMQLTAQGHDEVGFLVRSFNQMTQRLTHARNANQNSHRKLEQQTNHLATVLGSLSSGVITIDSRHFLRTANIASSKILGVNLQQRIEGIVSNLSAHHSKLSPLTLVIEQHFTLKESWQQQIEIQQQKGMQTLMCNGTPLPDNTGYVIVFDDVTALLQAQRNAAWGEVAKRLTHEIKNPLTPIQLSAERLQHKYLPLLPADQSETLTKLTSTIVQQVEAMKGMVNDFSDYARNPGLALSQQDIGELIRDVLTLYQSNPLHQFTLLNNPQNITLNLDANRFRQVLHNLLKNAIEASEDANLQVDIVLSYRTIMQDERSLLEIIIHDHGPGIPDEKINSIFEPYATNKQKGTGLGLAIVKKIIEEHHGHVWAENDDAGGARIVMHLPINRDKVSPKHER
ncbi:MAG: two-component sensor histidine kinase [Methylophaga sp.]|nr:MAG: two-component sensor histidine kinase [Methylophaga sp.]